MLRLNGAGCNKCSLPGFTLVELLVVIAIITILAGMVMPMFYSAKERAREAKAKVEVKALESAFKAYLDTYKVWPAAFFAYDDIDGDLFKTLRGDSDPVLNPQGIAFYEFGNMTNYPNQTTAYDPWSDPSVPSSLKAYKVKFDQAYNNVISIGGQDVYRSVVVWSLGKDRGDDSGGGDDVASWK